MRVRTSQTPSQFALISRPSLDICASHFAPAGLVANSNPLRWSENVSMTIRKRVARRGVEVLLQVADDDRRRVIVMREDTEVERLVVIKDAHFGVEGRRLSLAGFVLEKPAGNRRVAPGRFVQRSVERHRTGCARGQEPSLETCRRVIERRRDGLSRQVTRQRKDTAGEEENRGNAAVPWRHVVLCPETPGARPPGRRVP